MVTVVWAFYIQGVSANNDRSFPAKTGNLAKKSLIPCCSLPSDLFDEVHRGFDNQVFS